LSVENVTIKCPKGLKSMTNAIFGFEDLNKCKLYTSIYCIPYKKNWPLYNGLVSVVVDSINQSNVHEFEGNVDHY